MKGWLDLEIKPKKYDILCLGEVLIRYSSPGRERIAQCETFVKNAGGSELNVAAGAAQLGLKTGILTKLPANGLGEYIRSRIRMTGADESYVVMDASADSRLGVYYGEAGASPRKPRFFYDRKNSSFTSILPAEIPEELFGSAAVFHTSGITLALGEQAFDTAAETVRRMKKAGSLISFDVNYRANLWDEREAKAAIEKILPMVDILFVSEETSRRMFGKTGELRDIIKSYCAQYGVSAVATTSRRVTGPSRQSFGSVLYSREKDAFFTEKPYEGIDVVDRVGSGDAYDAGVLAGYLRSGGDFQQAVETGDAMSAVKDTVPGDLPLTNAAEIEKIRSAHKNGSAGEMER